MARDYSVEPARPPAYALRVKISVRPAVSAADYAAWRQVRLAVLLAVLPGERAPTIGELQAQAGPQQVYVLAGLDGTLARAAGAGLTEVCTWPQRGNDDMRALNTHLGYITHSESISMRASLPLRTGADRQRRPHLY